MGKDKFELAEEAASLILIRPSGFQELIREALEYYFYHNLRKGELLGRVLMLKSTGRWN